MRRIVYIQRTTALNQSPADIIAPLLGRVHGLAILQPLGLGPYDKAKVQALIDAAKAVGLIVLWWFCPGAYSFGRPEWTVPPRPGREGRDNPWLNFSLPEVRAHVASVATEMLDTMGYDGLNLDYIRWRWDILEYFPWASAEHITETVRLVRSAIGDSLLTAAVIRPEINPNTDEPRYVRFGQMWPGWLEEEGLIGWAQPMSYALRPQLEEWMDLMPDDPRVSPIITAGPTNKVDPLTPEQFGQCVEAILLRNRHPSVWDWRRATAEHWNQIPLLEEDILADISDDLRIIIAAMYDEITGAELAHAEQQQRLAALRGRADDLVAIADRIDVVDQAAEDLAAEI